MLSNQVLLVNMYQYILRRSFQEGQSIVELEYVLLMVQQALMPLYKLKPISLNRMTWSFFLLLQEGCQHTLKAIDGKEKLEKN